MTDIATGDLSVYFLFMLATMSVVSLPPLMPATLLAAKTSPPAAVALAAALAAACAAVVDYYLVRRAFRLRMLDELRRHGMFQRAERWAKVAPFLTTAAFAGFPLPFMVARVLMPLSGYPLPRYVAAVALGRFPKIFVIASFGTIVEIPNEILFAMLAIGTAFAVIGALVRMIRSRRAGPGSPHDDAPDP